MQEQVLEYFEAYFGETLNESTSDEDIMEAVYDLVALRDAVLESVGLNEAPTYDVNVHKYEVDHPDDAKRLPKKMKVKVPKDVHRDGKEHIEDYISNHISDTTGFLHHGFSYDKVKKESVELDEALRRPPRPSWDEIATRVAKRSAKEKPESDKSKQKRWDKAGLNLHNISDKSPNYVHRNNLKFDPNTGKLEESGVVNRNSSPKPHGIKSDPAYKAARTKKQIKNARDQWNLRNPMNLWVGESIEVDEGAKISRDPQLVIGLGKGRPAGRIEKKVKEFAPKELAISPERLADTRENIKSYLKSKLKKKSNIIKKKKLKSKMPGILPYTDAQWKAHKKKNNAQTTDINWSREYIKNKGKVPYGQRPKQKRPFGPKQKPGKDNVQPL